MEVFDQRNVSFVSVTQPFDTATPMGRLVLNVLLSFAQFEREIIGERIRDRITDGGKPRVVRYGGGRDRRGYALCGIRCLGNAGWCRWKRQTR